MGPTGVGRLTSGGLATYPWDASTQEQLFKKAAGTLPAAKRAGKNRILLIGEVDSHGVQVCLRSTGRINATAAECHLSEAT